MSPRLKYPTGVMPPGSGARGTRPTLPRPRGRGRDVKARRRLHAGAREDGVPGSPQGNPVRLVCPSLVLSRDPCPSPHPPAVLGWLHPELRGPWRRYGVLHAGTSCHFRVDIWISLQNAKFEIFPQTQPLIRSCPALMKLKLPPKLNAEQKDKKQSKSSPPKIGILEIWMLQKGHFGD